MRERLDSGWGRRVAGIAFSIGVVAVVTGAVYALRPVAPVVSLGVLYVLAVVAVAVVYGLAYAIPVSIGSMLVFNFLFLPPLHTFALRESENWVALAVYLIVGIVVGELATRSRRLAHEAVEAETLRQADAVKTAVLHAVSHDLRSPLTVIRAGAQLLHRRGEYREATVETILAYADRMARLIDDLADVVRLEEGHLPLQRESLDLVVLARECAVAANQQSANHEVRVEAPDASVRGAWDRVRLGQVVENLLGNALKHGGEEGEIVVRVEKRAGEALISVQDFGPGIDPDHLPHLFDRFYRANTRSSGLGLGLYISRILVEAHGGRIWAESQPGQGSTFTVSLPL